MYSFFIYFFISGLLIGYLKAVANVDYMVLPISVIPTTCVMKSLVL